ncbi:GspE/PulE family protein [Stutzerimonas stutzeri]
MSTFSTLFTERERSEISAGAPAPASLTALEEAVGAQVRTRPAHAIATADSAHQALIINNRQQLQSLPGRIVKLRPDIVGQSLASRLCPAVLESGTWVVLVTPDYVNSDLVQTTAKKCREASGGKDVVIRQITPTFLLTLREGGGYNTNLSGRKDSTTVYKAAFEEIIAWGVRNNASDVHLNVSSSEAVSQIRFSIDGKYVAPSRWAIPTDRLNEILNVAWMDSKGGASPIFNGDIEQQCRINLIVDHIRIMGRWASMATDQGPSVCIRLLKSDKSVVTQSLEDQGFLPSQVGMLERAQLSEGGAIILAGVVGSGKSTTIAHLLSSLPRTRKIITIEDPVEYRIANALQNTISRSLESNDDEAFSAKLKTIKRSAPHDLLLGEIRDRVTGQAFMDLSGSGTNVYATVHAKSACQIPERLASSAIGVPNSFLASPGILNLLVFQALIPVLCPHCALPLEALVHEGGIDIRGIRREPDYWKHYIERIARIYALDPQPMRIKNALGCPHCQRAEVPELNGYAGRTVVSEMIEPNADREILRYVMSGDTLRLQEHLERLERTPIADSDMSNKSIMECALYKAVNGVFDPRDIELRTRSFETDELIRRQYRQGG